MSKSTKVWCTETPKPVVQMGPLAPSFGTLAGTLEPLSY